MTLGPYKDLSEGPLDERVRRTATAITERVSVLYQPVFLATEKLLGTEIEIIGVPDFLISHGGGYLLRDSKMSRRIDERNHPEIIIQMQLYAWLFDRATGSPPMALQVHGGTGDITEIPHDGGTSALGELERILSIERTENEFYEPVGWSKCDRCGFRDRCWSQAEDTGDVALVFGVDQGLARILNSQGTRTRKDLLSNFNGLTLSELKRPYGPRFQRVGKPAARILQSAESMEKSREIVLQAPSIPMHDNYVMFDLEGMPPSLDELEKIYMWGAQVYGENPSEFMAAVSGFGPNGDREGWFGFLDIVAKIFERCGEIPFVHWANYEKINLDRYVERYGDPQGLAARVRGCLLDLLEVTKEAIVLPLPSYSLKVVEDYIGFERKGEEYGGQWAMATFIEATETSDEQKRSELMDQILAYNREDLEATWAVFRWLRAKQAP